MVQSSFNDRQLGTLWGFREKQSNITLKNDSQPVRINSRTLKVSAVAKNVKHYDEI